MTTVQYFIGVDLGKKRDATAIAVIEKFDQQMYGRDWITYGSRLTDMSTQYRLRHLERTRLGTSYTAVVARVQLLALKLAAVGPTVIVVDGTGVGEPVADLLRELKLPCEITAIVITGAERERRVSGGYTVPKQSLMTGLQVAFEKGGLVVADGLREWPRLLRELMEVRIFVGSSGAVRYAAREPEHDDLVLAVALALWRAKRAEVGEKGDRLI